MIEIFTDGSSRKSSNDGGYGVIVFKKLEDNKSAIIYAYQEQFKNVTNNQMELQAIIHACEFADTNYPNEEVIIYSDSSYCVNSINEWMYGWARNGWINSKKEQVKNIDLMKTLYKYFNTDFYHCQVQKTKAHYGIFGNELADALATTNANKFAQVIKQNNIKIMYTPTQEEKS